MNKKHELKEYLKKKIIGQSEKCDDLGDSVDNSIPVLPHDFLKETPYSKSQIFEIPEGKEFQKIKTSKGKFGDLEANWVDEGAVIPASKEKFHAKTMKSGKLAVLVGTTGEIDQDVSYLQTFLRTKLPKAISYAINNAMIYGSDIHNASVKGIVADSKQLTYFTPEVDLEVAIPDMYAKVLFSEDNQWYFGKSAWQKVIENAFGFIQFEGKDAYIFGQPAKCVSWLNNDDVVYGDFGFYAISQKPLQQEVSEHFLFDSDQNMLKTTIRMAGEVPYLEPFTTREIEAKYDVFDDDELEIEDLSDINLYTMTLDAGDGEDNFTFTYNGTGFIADNCKYEADVNFDTETITLVDEYITNYNVNWDILSNDKNTQGPSLPIIDDDNTQIPNLWYTNVIDNADYFFTLNFLNLAIADADIATNFFYVKDVTGPIDISVGWLDGSEESQMTIFSELEIPDAGNKTLTTEGEVAVSIDSTDHKSIIISGFGEDSVNGEIHLNASDLKPGYRKYNEDGVAMVVVLWDDGEWIIASRITPTGSLTERYKSTQDVATPDLVTNWVGTGVIGTITKFREANWTKFVFSGTSDVKSFKSIEWDIQDIETVDWSEYNTTAYWTETSEVSEYAFAALSAMEIGKVEEDV